MPKVKTHLEHDYNNYLWTRFQYYSEALGHHLFIENTKITIEKLITQIVAISFHRRSGCLYASQINTQISNATTEILIIKSQLPTEDNSG